MQKLITTSGTQIPVYQIMRHSAVPSLEIKILESNLTISQDGLMTLLKTPDELSILTLKTEDDILMNQYQNYSKMDTYDVKFNYVVQDAIEAVKAVEAVVDKEGNTIQEAISATPAVQEVVDNLITIFLLQKSNLESQVESNRQLVDAISVAIAELMGV